MWLVEPVYDLLGGELAFFRHVHRLADNVAVARGQVPGVHHIDVGKLRSRHAGVLVAGGEIGADVDVDNRITFRKEPGEQLLIVAYIIGGGGAQVAPGGNVVEDVLGMDVHPVPEGFAALHGVEGQKLHPVGLEIVGA